MSQSTESSFRFTTDLEAVRKVSVSSCFVLPPPSSPLPLCSLSPPLSPLHPETKQYLLAPPCFLLAPLIIIANSSVEKEKKEKKPQDSLATWTPRAGSGSDQLPSHPVLQALGFINVLSSTLDCNGRLVCDCVL